MVINRQRRVKFRKADIASFVEQLEREVFTGGEMGVVIVSDSVIRRFNLRFRNVDKATDVLSFDPCDLMISAETAARQAREFKHSIEIEMKVLALHGALHLMGYDHEKDRGRMARAEREWRTRLGLPMSLIERSA